MPGCRSLQVTPPGLLLEPHRWGREASTDHAHEDGERAVDAVLFTVEDPRTTRHQRVPTAHRPATAPETAKHEGQNAAATSPAGGGRPRPAASPTWCSPRSAWILARRRWSAWPTGPTGDTDLLRAVAEAVHRVAAAVLADLDQCDQPRETAACSRLLIRFRSARPATTDDQQPVPTRGPERFAPSLLLVSPGSVGGLEGVHHGLRNPATVGDLVAVLPSPRPDRRGLLPVEWLRPRTGARGHLLRPPAAHRIGSATVADGRDKRRQRVAQPGGVVIGQVNLIGPAVDGERDRACRIRPVEVVDES